MHNFALNSLTLRMISSSLLNSFSCAFLYFFLQLWLKSYLPLISSSPLCYTLYCAFFEGIEIILFPILFTQPLYTCWYEFDVFFTAWKVSVFGVFLVRIVGKYGPENLRIRTLFTQCLSLEYLHLAGFLKSLQVSHATKSLVLKLVFECCFQYTSVINYSAQFLCLAKFLLVVWLGFLFLLLLIDIASIIRPFSRIFNHTTVLCLCWISSSSAP